MIAALTAEENRIVEEVASVLKAILGADLSRLVLFGSRARGDYEPESDIDLAIVVRQLTRETKNRILDIIADLEMKHLVPLSALVISEETLDSLKKKERRLALDIEAEGIPL